MGRAAFLAVLLGLVLGACESDVGEDTGAWPKSQAQVGRNIGVRVDLPDGPPVPMARLLAESVAGNLIRNKVPATTDPASDSRYVLSGETSVNEDAKTGSGGNILIRWTLKDADGATVGVHTQGVKGTQVQWDYGDPRIIRAVGDGAAKPIAAMVRTDTEAAAAPPKRRGATGILINPVQGAPGDGNAALATALRAALRAVDLNVTDDFRQAAFTLDGRVTVTGAPGAQDRVRIVWSLSTLAGEALGNAVQENTVRGGSLDGPWGHVAILVASAAVEGIEQVMEGSRRRRRMALPGGAPPRLPPSYVPADPTRAPPPGY